MWNDKIRQRMKEQHIANKTLAAHLGVLDSTISHWLSGRCEPSYAALVSIAHYLDVSLDWLFLDTPMMQPTVNIGEAILEAQGFPETIKMVPVHPPAGFIAPGRVRKPAGMA